MCGAARHWVVRIPAIVLCCLFLGSGQHVQAGSMYKITITGGPPPDDASTAYNGDWVFNVDLSPDKKKIIFTVVSGNTKDNTEEFKTDTYKYDVTVKGGVYSFDGRSVGTLPDSKLYDLGMKGTYTPGTGNLTIDNPVTSKKADGSGDTYNFKWTNIKMIPEPSSLVLGLIAAGVLGGGLAWRRRRERELVPAHREAV